MLNIPGLLIHYGDYYYHHYFFLIEVGRGLANCHWARGEYKQFTASLKAPLNCFRFKVRFNESQLSSSEKLHLFVWEVIINPVVSPNMIFAMFRGGSPSSGAHSIIAGAGNCFCTQSSPGWHSAHDSLLGSGDIQYLSEWDWNRVPILSLKQWWNLEFLAIEGFILPLVFRYVSFFCRDLLPFTLKLPQAILEARSFQDLEIISSLGIGKSLKAAWVSLRLVTTTVPPTDTMQRWIDKLLSSEQVRKPEYEWEDICCLYGSTLRKKGHVTTLGLLCRVYRRDCRDWDSYCIS